MARSLGKAAIRAFWENLTNSTPEMSRKFGSWHWMVAVPVPAYLVSWGYNTENAGKVGSRGLLLATVMILNGNTEIIVSSIDPVKNALSGGWVFQERNLSGRFVHFSKDELL